MFVYGLVGFLIGMIVGGFINRILLRHVPSAEWRKNRNIKLKYGAFNWLCGLLGLIAALYLARFV